MKTKIVKLVKDIEARQAGVARERDRLDNLIGEAEDLRETCREAYDALQEARDALSKLA